MENNSNKQKITDISNLSRALVIEDYAAAIEIITKPSFDPNETTKILKSPVLSALVEILSSTDIDTDNENLKTILFEIAKNDKLEINKTDTEGETLLMRIASCPKFNWLLDTILLRKNIETERVNVLNETALDIAIKHRNDEFVSILLKHAKNFVKWQPKKIIGIKCKTFTNPSIIRQIDYTFYVYSRFDPYKAYRVLKSFFDGNYTECKSLIEDKSFNPNETDGNNTPLITLFIRLSQDSKARYDENMFKEVIKLILSNPKFNSNLKDAEGNTPLMAAMEFPKLDWLIRLLFDPEKTNINDKNEVGETIGDIADYCGNTKLYEELVRSMFKNVQTID